MANLLKCPRCGATLELCVSYDGLSEEAERYCRCSPEWGWSIQMECTECSAVYPIGRTRSYFDVSKLKEASADVQGNH